ncbi:hypothetical protein [Selenihalanaerobacter shriftii]|uniref:Uncharacterized protein n=1 Tax=Selenihalanaerobacter shriftii TaxID=142842 RepID=A0A1T4JVK8_9FIRM|nr:hypothetical protein [Selenihalanaerobacter shriftii]SJZ34174.1 hypothetical protein SAMN02745118_00450 [Selenihalanaerobacter shriftii]
MSSKKVINLIEEKVKEKVVNNSLKCVVAQKIAKDLGVTNKEVGKVINQLNIKLIDCQLGCF